MSHAAFWSDQILSATLVLERSRKWVQNYVFKVCSLLIVTLQKQSVNSGNLQNGLLKNYKCALFYGLPWRELHFSSESLKEARRRRYGPLSKSKKLILPFIYLGMDGINFRLIKGDYREWGYRDWYGVEEEVLQTTHAAGELSNTLLYSCNIVWKPGGGAEALGTAWVWELQLRRSSMGQEDTQAHLVHEPTVPWGAVRDSLVFPKQCEG